MENNIPIIENPIVPIKVKINILIIRHYYNSFIISNEIKVLKKYNNYEVKI
jgi:hypothetical protein